METAEKLFERAKRLKTDELARLVALVESHLSSEIDAKFSSGGEHHAELLALSGIGDSDYTDVSLTRPKHLAQAYRSKAG